MDRMANQTGLSLIKVDKKTLLDKLKLNRDNHVSEYDNAVEGYKQSVVDELTRWLEKARTGKKVITRIIFDEPACHEEDYDTVIQMLEMSVDDTVYVTMTEFKQYVEDKWGWKEAFSMTNAKYM